MSQSEVADQSTESAETGKGAPTLHAMFGTTKDRQDLCLLMILAWIACCDGEVAPREMALMRQWAAGSSGGEGLLAVVDVAKAGRVEDLELACRYLGSHMDRGEKRLLAELAVTMAVEDGHVTV